MRRPLQTRSFAVCSTSAVPLSTPKLVSPPPVRPSRKLLTSLAMGVLCHSLTKRICGDEHTGGAASLFRMRTCQPCCYVCAVWEHDLGHCGSKRVRKKPRERDRVREQE